MNQTDKQNNQKTREKHALLVKTRTTETASSATTPVHNEGVEDE